MTALTTAVQCVLVSDARVVHGLPTAAAIEAVDLVLNTIDELQLAHGLPLAHAAEIVARVAAACSEPAPPTPARFGVEQVSGIGRGAPVAPRSVPAPLSRSPWTRMRILRRQTGARR